MQIFSKFTKSQNFTLDFASCVQFVERQKLYLLGNKNEKEKKQTRSYLPRFCDSFQSMFFFSRRIRVYLDHFFVHVLQEANLPSQGL